METTPLTYSRQCIRCTAPIAECMGFVLARDVLAQSPTPREICGLCGVLALFLPGTEIGAFIDQRVPSNSSAA